jgi:hypothetical protein
VDRSNRIDLASQNHNLRGNDLITTRMNAFTACMCAHKGCNSVTSCRCSMHGSDVGLHGLMKAGTIDEDAVSQHKKQQEGNRAQRHDA